MKILDEQMERYSRNIMIKDIGVQGQLKLLNAKVLVIGVGGLGSPAVMYLAASGVGTIGIADPDKVALSNLQRQIIHHTKDLGRKKVFSAQDKIQALNPDIAVHTYAEWITSENISDIIANLDYDFVLDCTDNLSAKFLINDACVLAHKPFSHASIAQLMGQTFTYIPSPETSCYRCMIPSPPPENAVLSSRKDGILGAIGGILGSIQATETIKYITGVGELLVNHMLFVDANNMQFLKIRIHKNSKCPICGR